MTIVGKLFILDVCEGPDYVSERSVVQGTESPETLKQGAKSAQS